MELLACYPLGSGFCPLFHFLPALSCPHAMEPELLRFHSVPGPYAVVIRFLLLKREPDPVGTQ